MCKIAAYVRLVAVSSRLKSAAMAFFNTRLNLNKNQRSTGACRFNRAAAHVGCGLCRTMHILSRYVLAELAKVFLISLAALTILIILVGVVRQAADQNLPMAQVARLIPFVLPDALRIAVPMTLLLAVTSVYGRMAGTNEIVAIKAMGISPMALLWPTLVAAFLVSLVTVWLNDVAVSWGRNGARRVIVEAVDKIAYSMLKTQKQYSSPNFSIVVRDVEGRRLIQPTFTVTKPPVTITADEAQLIVDLNADVLLVELTNAEIDFGEDGKLRHPGIYRHEIPLHQATRTRSTAELPSWEPLCVIPGQIAEHKEFMRQRRAKLAVRAAHQMLCGDFDLLVGPQWATVSADSEQLHSRLCRLLIEPHRRWSAGFSCLCFVWIGAPMAIRRRKSDFLTSFFLCFLPILIIYYPLLAYGIDGAKGGTIPAEAVWVGNILLLLWGAWLLRKVIRY